MSLAFFTFLCVIPAAIGAAPTLTATPAVLPVSGAEVTLKFDLGGAAPAAADVVEVVSGGVSIGLLPVSMASGWESGAAAFPPMPLVNMLTDGYLFNYKSGVSSGGENVLLMWLWILGVCCRCVPTHTHIHTLYTLSPPLHTAHRCCVQCLCRFSHPLFFSFFLFPGCV